MPNQIENLRKFTFLSNPQTNASQNLAAFVVSNIDYANDRYINKLYTFNGTELRPLTEAGSESSYFFEDEENIIFKSPSRERYNNNNDSTNKAPQSHYYRIAVDGGEATYAFTIPLAVDKLLPLNERNKFLVLASYDLTAPDLWQKSGEEQNAYMEKLTKANHPRIINEIPFQSNGQGYLYNQRSALFFYDALSNELELISKNYPNYVINWLTLNNSKTKAAFAATPYERADEYRWQAFAKLYELDIKTGEISELYTVLDQQLGDGFYIETINKNAKSTGKEELIVISSDTKDYGINQNNHFYLYDYTQHNLHKLSDYEVEYGNSVGADVTYGHNSASYKSSSSVYNLIETKGNSSILSAWTLLETSDTSYPQLEQKIMLEKTGSILSCFTLAQDSEIVIAANACTACTVSRETSYSNEHEETSTISETENNCACSGNDTCADKDKGIESCSCSKPQSLFVLGLFEQELTELYLVNTPTKLLRLSYFNDAHTLGLTSIKPERISFQSPYDQCEITGFILLPPNFVKGKTANYPLILDIHGGPKTVYSSTYYHEMQVWASLGFIVCFTNPHGSDGRGNAFADIRGAYGQRDYEDLMCFLNKVLASYPEIDQNRLGVTGGSYGGFMTNWIITHTQRFKAACSQRSISNWLSFYGTSDIGYYFATDQNKVKAFSREEQDILWEHSPLKYINDAKTPTLFIHSDEDYRCPLEQGMQIHTALRALGVTSKLCIFPGENHDLSRNGKPQAREWRLNLITHWFLKHLQSEQTKLINEYEAKINDLASKID